MALDPRVSNNIDNYANESNYRWYYKPFVSTKFKARLLGFPQLPKELPVTPADVRYTVPESHTARIDMIAKDFYGNDYLNLIWIIMLYNGIQDPFQEIQPGTELYIPDRSTFEGVLV